MKENENTIPRVLARLTSEELEVICAGYRCPIYKTTDPDGYSDVGGGGLPTPDGWCE